MERSLPLNKIRVKGEKSSFFLLATLSVVIYLILLICTCGGILILMLILGLIRWILVRLIRANMIGNGVMVSETNFPQIYEITKK